MRSTALLRRFRALCWNACRSAKLLLVIPLTLCLSHFSSFATENPIDQEGTYPLPEAQVDRFMLKLRVDYPSKEEELAISLTNRLHSIRG